MLLCFNRNLNLGDPSALENSGANYLAQIEIMPLVWNEEPGLIIIIMEFNEHLHAFNLVNQSKIKDELLAIVSHDLKTPLNGIISMVESIRYSTKKK